MKFGLRHLLSNALKNFAPAAFLVPGVGPGLGAAIGGLGSAAGQGLSRHPSLGGALKAGAFGAAEGYAGGQLSGGQGARGVMGTVRNAFVPSSSATAAVPGAGPGPSGAAMGLDTSVNGAQYGDEGYNAVAGVTPATGGTALAPKTPRSFLSRAGDFVEGHPNALGMGMQGLGAMATSDSTNAANRAMAARTAAETDTLEAERRRKAAQDAALEPLRRALAGQLGGFNANAYRPAPNPYASNQTPNPYLT